MLTLSNGNTIVLSSALLDASPTLCRLVDTGEGPTPAMQADAARAYALVCNPSIQARLAAVEADREAEYTEARARMAASLDDGAITGAPDATARTPQCPQCRALARFVPAYAWVCGTCNVRVSLLVCEVADWAARSRHPGNPTSQAARIIRFLLSHDLDNHDVITMGPEGYVVVVGADRTHELRTLADARAFAGY